MSEVRAVEAFLRKGRGLISIHRKIVYEQMTRDFVRAVRKSLDLTTDEAEGVLGSAYKEMIAQVVLHGGGKIGREFEETVECSEKGNAVGKVVLSMLFEQEGIRMRLTVTPADKEKEQETDGDGFGMYEEGGGRK